MFNKIINKTKKFYYEHQKALLFIYLLLFLITFFFDNQLLVKGVELRFNSLDGLMLYLTDFGMLFFAIILVFYLIIHQNWKWLILLILSLACSFEITYLLKLIFQVPRPYFSMELATIPLTQAAGYSFPSLHSAFCIGIIPFIPKIFKFKWQKALAFIICLIIALSRPYLGVHFVSDILAGGLIGFLTSKYLIFAEDNLGFSNWFLTQIKTKLEVRRQLAHIVFGVIIVFLIELRLLTPELLLIILFLGLILSFLTKKYQIPFIHKILVLFERPQDLNSFPGKGPIFLVFGAYLCLMFFPLNIAKASIMILTLGDSFSHLIGKYFGTTKVPFNQDKMLEGSIMAIIIATLGALLFVKLSQAFFASLITITIEAIYPKKMAKYIDDNLFMPILAGIIMLILI